MSSSFSAAIFLFFFSLALSLSLSLCALFSPTNARESERKAHGFRVLRETLNIREPKI